MVLSSIQALELGCSRKRDMNVPTDPGDKVRNFVLPVRPCPFGVFIFSLLVPSDIGESYGPIVCQ